MNHTDHLKFLRQAVNPGEVWADLGSGDGAFTLALVDLLGPTGTVYSVATDGSALNRQRTAIDQHFPDSTVHIIYADFRQPLDLPSVDGLLMANSLHFHRHKEPILEQVQGYIKPGGSFVLIEYDSARGNMWVPHPISYKQWEAYAAQLGFKDTRQLYRHQSRFLNGIYSALSRWEG